jgi:hypothetical protein
VIRAAALLAATLGSAVASARPSDFRFTAPGGAAWVDRAPPESRSEALAARYAAYAVEPTRRLSFHAVVGEGAEAVTAEFLIRYAEQIETEVAERTERASLNVLESSVVKVGGVRAARIVAEVTTFSGGRLRQLIYYLPSRTQHAVLTFSSPPERFGGAKDEFDRAAAATLGSAEPPARHRPKR